MTETFDSAGAETRNVATASAGWRINWSALVPLIFAAYFVFGLIFAWLYRYQINPDGISYIQIAEQYRLGNWHHAINGYWGPLISWLLVPLLALDLSPQVAFRLLNWAIGGLTLYGAWRISRHFDLSELVRTAFLFLSALMIVTWSVSVITPDLLVVCILVFVLDRIFSTNHTGDILHPIGCGLLGGLAYLAKPFAFVFILIILPISFLWQANSCHRERSFKFRSVLLPIFIAVASFFVLAIPWIITISNKYGDATISASGAYNLALKAPGAQGQAHYTSGLQSPQFKGAVSEWYDPSFELPGWNPLRSRADLVHEAGNIAHNVLYRRFLGFVSIVVVGLMLAGLVGRPRLELPRSATGFSILAVSIYSGLYSLVLVESRYLWPMMILLWLSGLGLVRQMGRQSLLPRMSSFMLYGLLFFLILLNPIIIGISGTEMVLI